MGEGGTSHSEMLESRPGTASSQACCQQAKENTGGDGGEVGRCETDQTMDVRNVLLVQAKEKRSGGGVEEGV